MGPYFLGKVQYWVLIRSVFFIKIGSLLCPVFGSTAMRFHMQSIMNKKKCHVRQFQCFGNAMLCTIYHLDDYPTNWPYLAK